jgi:hypothetical protein
MAVAPPGGWIVLCSAGDASALWVYERLRVRGHAPIDLLFVESLAHAAVRWEHGIGARGATLTLTTGDGRRLCGTDVGAVLNRLVSAPLGMVDAAEPEDRDYARNELTAFAASWLRTLSARVVNAPHPHGLCGRWRQPLEWRALAVRAGLVTAPLRLASVDPDMPRPVGFGDEPGTTTVLAVDGRILHTGVPSAVQRACAQLSRLCATRVLGLRFDGTDPARDWRFLDATPYPNLSLAGESGVAALEAALSA